MRRSVAGSQRVALSELRPHPENPRRISKERLEQLKRSLDADPAMLAARPLIALPDGTVIAGNMRLRAARELGWQEIDVVYADLDETTARLWMLRDNNAFGDWDERPLAEMLASLEQGGVEVALAGFQSRTVDELLAGIADRNDRGEPPDPGPKPEAPRSKVGEVYELGQHRLLCGDARDGEAMAAFVGDAPPQVMWTDPPYGVEYVGKTKRALTIAGDERGELADLLQRSFAAIDGVLAPGARIYVAAPAGPQGTTFRRAFVDAGWRLHQVLVWVKDTMVLGHSDYHYQHEDVLYGWKPGEGRVGRGRHSGSRWYGDNSQTSVFHFPKPRRSEDHPTMKPPELVASHLANSAGPRDVVLDPFAGSGSTLIAAEQLGLRSLLVELDRGYCDVIRDRWERWHGG